MGCHGSYLKTGEALEGGDPPLRVGRFLVWAVTGAAPSLRIAHSDEPSRVLWDGAVPGGFLQAGTAETEIEENTTPASGFTISDRRLLRYRAQTVDAAEMRDGALVLRGGLHSDRGSTGAYTMTWSAVGDRQLRFQVDLERPDLNRVFLRYRSDAAERFWGFGQQLTYFDQKGRRLPILVQEHGVGRGMPVITQLVAYQLGPRSAGNWATTEVSVPQYISSRNRSLLLENTEYSVFDLRHPDMVEIEEFAGHLTGQVLYGATALELIETVTLVTGRMRELPDWVHEGAIVCAQGGTAIVDGIVTTLADAQVPVSAVWVQDWIGVNVTPFGRQVQWNWILDESYYFDWERLRTTMEERLGARTAVYVNPFLTNTPGHNQLYAEAERLGYLVKTKKEEVYQIKNGGFSAGLLDLSNPAARAWIKSILAEKVVGIGATAWMADFGEALPFDAVLHSGDPAVWHNRYPEEWARIHREVIDDNGLAADGLFWSRSGYLRSPGHSTLFWVGDQMQVWNGHDGLKSAITGCLSGGLSGFSLVHSDIGGFSSITATVPRTSIEVAIVHRTKDLLLRWAEHSALSPVMRTHQGIDPAAAWQIDQDADTLETFRRIVLLYRAWAPYRRKLSADAARRGYPIMRAMALHYPDDPAAVSQQYQYLLGDALLVAPVTEPNTTDAPVYLPAGHWYHPWNGGRTYVVPAGGLETTVEAPLGNPPLFIRVDAPEYGELREAFAAPA